MYKKMQLTNWGNYPKHEICFHEVFSIDELKQKFEKHDGVIARGLGRCYGDSSLAENVLSMLRLNHFLDFNAETGYLICEAGVSFQEIIQVCLPKGWFLPVTPGTKFITVGGAIASDVHGKNHHKEGSFCDFVLSVDLMLPGGKVIKCSRSENTEIFHATCGGMGLTGIILSAEIQLKKVETGWIKQNIYVAHNLDTIFELFQSTNECTYSVAWIDCLKKGRNTGRSVLLTGEHASREDIQIANSTSLFFKKNQRSIPVPFFAPGITLNRLTVSLFNQLYFNFNKLKRKDALVHFDPFFYPLDSLLNWNRIYGKKGFVQYQFVLPEESSKVGLRKLMNTISDHGEGSFLAVLKLFGNKNNSLLGFPQKGYTLALDFPLKKNTMGLLDKLDNMVLDYGGKLYLTKDARMSPNVFNHSYSNLEGFRDIKNRIDPTSKIVSFQSKRLQI